jgi:predicted GNAT superfamily acetyltransferase
VNTQPANPASQAFHERLDFGPSGTLATQDGRQVLLLLRRLDPALNR